MSLEEAYRLCTMCNKHAIACDYHGRKREDEWNQELDQEDAHKHDLVERAMDRAIEELEMVFMEFITACKFSSRSSSRVKPDAPQPDVHASLYALQACCGCNYENPAIVKLLEKELPGRFKPQEKKEEQK